MSASKPTAPIGPSPRILAPIPKMASPATAKTIRIAKEDKMVFDGSRSSSKLPKKFTASMTAITEDDEIDEIPQFQLGTNIPRATSPTSSPPEEEVVMHPFHRSPVTTPVKHARILRHSAGAKPEGLRKEFLRSSIDPAILEKARISAEASKSNSQG